MAKLIAYGMLSISNNAITGNLVKAQCELCGRKFGSIEEARKCEVGHFNKAINDLLEGELNEKVYINRSTT